MNKLTKAIEKQGLGQDLLFAEDKLEVLNYRMGDPLLGLSQKTYEQLSREVTKVIREHSFDCTPLPSFVLSCVHSSLVGIILK